MESKSRELAYRKVSTKKRSGGDPQEDPPRTLNQNGGWSHFWR